MHRATWFRMGLSVKSKSAAYPLPVAVGKRVFCSNRNHHAGCGRTTQLYLAETIRYLHYSGSVVMAFILALMAKTSIAHAYTRATTTATPRHAYRWLNGLCAQLSSYRSLLHQPPLSNNPHIANDAKSANSAQSAL